MRKLFCFGYYFPPSRAPEAIVSAKRTAGLKGWRVTFSAFQMGDEDQRLAAYADQNFDKVVRLQLPWWVRILPKSVLSRLPVLPDWLVLVTRYAAGSLGRIGVGNSDVFMTCSQSHSAHMVGLEIKRQYPNLPWIAHFSDPWASNPYINHIQQKREKVLEKKVFEAADLLVFTSDETCEQVKLNYPKAIGAKMRVLPHAYDPKLFVGDDHIDPVGIVENKGKVVIRHIGALYGKRSPLPFFRALELLSATSNGVLKNVRFELIGPIDPEFDRALKDSEILSEILTLGAPVSYLESLNLMKSADALLAIDAPAEKSVFLPSKLIDYIGSRKPVLALSPPGTSRSVVESYGGLYCNPDDIPNIAAKIGELIGALRGDGGKVTMNEEVRSRFHVEKVGEVLATYLSEVLESRYGEF